MAQQQKKPNNREGEEGKMVKGIRKQSQLVEMTGLTASSPTRIKKGKEQVNGLRNPNE